VFGFGHLKVWYAYDIQTSRINNSADANITKRSVYSGHVEKNVMSMMVGNIE
jgi:hypothetical protein